MAYWWANQNKNYRSAIEQGSLWSCPTASGLERADRAALKQMRVGDLVFHNFNGALRAVSEVTTSWEWTERPPRYPKVRADDLDEGWYVQVTPLVTALFIQYTRVASLILLGNGGPMATNGRPAQKYVSPLRPRDGETLLAEVNPETPKLPRGSNEISPATWGGVATDKVTVGTTRQEQGRLRWHLLGDQQEAECALCGRVLPRQLLVAAHIVPRSRLNEEERRNFDSVAMLACTLGCDSLFELGYVAVGADGRIEIARAAETAYLSEVVNSLVGRSCSAYNSQTATGFAKHYQQW